MDIDRLDRLDVADELAALVEVLLLHDDVYDRRRRGPSGIATGLRCRALRRAQDRCREQPDRRDVRAQPAPASSRCLQQFHRKVVHAILPGSMRGYTASSARARRKFPSPDLKASVGAPTGSQPFCVA
jgi:hypothetical protein